MSNDLIQQLKACAVKLQTCAEQLQQKIRNKKDKNKHYVAILAEATVFIFSGVQTCDKHLLVFL